jgi:hypothetical protein
MKSNVSDDSTIGVIDIVFAAGLLAAVFTVTGVALKTVISFVIDIIGSM